MLAGLHNPGIAGAVTNVLQISVNKQNTQLMAVGNFITVDGQTRSPDRQVRHRQPARPAVDTDRAPDAVPLDDEPLHLRRARRKFDTYMTDVEYSPDGSYFVVSTTGAYGGTAQQHRHLAAVTWSPGSRTTPTAARPATWTAYTGGDTTWTVEVTDNVVYAGGHQRWQNNPTAGDQAGQGAVSREGIAALNPVNGMPYSWNPTRARGVGVQDMLATSDGLYVGSDTDADRSHGRQHLPRRDRASCRSPAARSCRSCRRRTLPVDLYRVATGASQLTRRSFTGTTVGTADQRAHAARAGAPAPARSWSTATSTRPTPTAPCRR